MSAVQLLVLKYLKESADAGFPFAALDDYNLRTVRALVKHDWIIESDGLDGTKYKLTGRGAKALSEYSTPKKRHYSDGLCPDCRQREKHVGKSGFQFGYCYPCYKERQSKKYAEKGYQKNPGICSRCNKRQKHITSTGNVRSYCKVCRREVNKGLRKRSQERLNARLDAGEFIPCIKCKVRPRHRHKNTVYDYCYTCYRKYMNNYHQKWQYRQVLKKHGVDHEQL